MKEENKKLKLAPVEDNEEFKISENKGKQSSGRIPENDRPPPNKEKISELTKKLADKEKERRNICCLLALLVLLISLLCGKMFMLDESKERPIALAAANKDDCRQIQKKYEHKISEYSLLQTSMEKAAKDHARQLKIANTDVVAAKKREKEQSQYYKAEKEAHIEKKEACCRIRRENCGYE